MLSDETESGGEHRADEDDPDDHGLCIGSNELEHKISPR
jgi:hypothetical protein